MPPPSHHCPFLGSMIYHEVFTSCTGLSASSPSVPYSLMQVLCDTHRKFEAPSLQIRSPLCEGKLLLYNTRLPPLLTSHWSHVFLGVFSMLSIGMATSFVTKVFTVAAASRTRVLYCADHGSLEFKAAPILGIELN